MEFGKGNAADSAPGGFAGWLLSRWHNRTHTQARLALLERINLAPRQTLCLIEAEGRKFLVASSPQSAPAFYPLESREPGSPNPNANRRRVSW
jgi:hypothetical protein